MFPLSVSLNELNEDLTQGPTKIVTNPNDPEKAHTAAHLNSEKLLSWARLGGELGCLKIVKIINRKKYVRKRDFGRHTVR